MQLHCISQHLFHIKSNNHNSPAQRLRMNENVFSANNVIKMLNKKSVNDRTKDRFGICENQLSNDFCFAHS